MDPNQQNRNNNDQTPPPPQPGQHVDTNPPPPASSPPPPGNTPSQTGNPQQNQQQPQNQPSQEPAPQNDEDVPDYLQGAGPPPGPGQAMHPPGGYQAKPGEVVQRSAAGGAVVQNVDEENTTRSSVYAPPAIPQPSQPTRQVDNTPTGYSPQYGQDSYQNEQSQGRNYRVIFLLLFFVVLLIAGGLIYFASSEDSQPTGDQQIDSELRNDLGIIRGAITTYKVRNGSFPNLTPDAIEQLRADFLPLEFNSPRTSEPYVLVTQSPNEGEVQYVLGGICDSEGSIEQTGSEQTFALLTNLSDGSVYCLDRDERPQDEQN